MSWRAVNVAKQRHEKAHRHDRFEISDGGFVHWAHNHVAHVLKHTGGMVSLVSHRSMAIHATMDERTLRGERGFIEKTPPKAKWGKPSAAIRY
jgi:hypothetical protein